MHRDLWQIEPSDFMAEAAKLPIIRMPRSLLDILIWGLYILPAFLPRDFDSWVWGEVLNLHF